jgi:hypothetical protein
MKAGVGSPTYTHHVVPTAVRQASGQQGEQIDSDKVEHAVDNSAVERDGSVAKVQL